MAAYWPEALFSLTPALILSHRFRRVRNKPKSFDVTEKRIYAHTVLLITTAEWMTGCRNIMSLRVYLFALHDDQWRWRFDGLPRLRHAVVTHQYTHIYIISLSRYRTFFFFDIEFEYTPTADERCIIYRTRIIIADAYAQFLFQNIRFTFIRTMVVREKKKCFPPFHRRRSRRWNR